MTHTAYLEVVDLLSRVFGETFRREHLDASFGGVLHKVVIGLRTHIVTSWRSSSNSLLESTKPARYKPEYCYYQVASQHQVDDVACCYRRSSMVCLSVCRSRL